MNKTEVTGLLEVKKSIIESRFVAIDAKDKTINQSIALLTEQKESLSAQRDRLDSKIEKCTKYLDGVADMREDGFGDELKDTARLRNVKSFLKV